MTARILVVDDVPANRRVLEARLTAEYFDVVSAASGAEALSICERAECDLVLLDVMMPDMDGFEVCRRLKSDPVTQHIPVVMVTALDQASGKPRSTSPSSRSGSRTTTACGCAATCARSIARANCRCSRSPMPRTMRG